MVIALLGVSIIILGLMTLTLILGHIFVRNINCKLCVLDTCPLEFKPCMVTTNMKKIMHSIICVTDVYSREIFYNVLVGQVSRLVENFNIGIIFSDIINVINVKLCMTVLLIELYLFMPVEVTLTTFQCYSNVEQF